MDIQYLKQYVYENNLVQTILESIGCHHVKFNGNYWTCANHDGDNSSAITIYNTDFLNVVNYTRDITNNGKLPSDLITLVGYSKQLSFFETIKFVCNELGLSYYHDFEEDIPESIKITKLLFQMSTGNIETDDSKPLKPISEKILKYYKPYVNDMFFNDNINYETQLEFEIGYDEESNRITIPIRSEIGDLIGVKGRLFSQVLNEQDLKYMYLEPCAKGRILYGLNKTHEYIKEKGFVYIGESEKFVLQLWSMGCFNSVSLGGKKPTKHQIEHLIRLGVDLIFAFDKDVEKKELEEMSNLFIDGVKVYCLVDDENLLSAKESPSDNNEKWHYLIEKCMIRIK